MKKYLVGKDWRRKRMANPDKKDPSLKWRDDGLTNHERVIKQRAERKLILEQLRKEADESEKLETV